MARCGGGWRGGAGSHSVQGWSAGGGATSGMFNGCVPTRGTSLALYIEAR